MHHQVKRRSCVLRPKLDGGIASSDAAEVLTHAALNSLVLKPPPHAKCILGTVGVDCHSPITLAALGPPGSGHLSLFVKVPAPAEFSTRNGDLCGDDCLFQVLDIRQSNVLSSTHGRHRA